MAAFPFRVQQLQQRMFDPQSLKHVTLLENLADAHFRRMNVKIKVKDGLGRTWNTANREMTYTAVGKQTQKDSANWKPKMGVWTQCCAGESGTRTGRGSRDRLKQGTNQSSAKAPWLGGWPETDTQWRASFPGKMTEELFDIRQENSKIPVRNTESTQWEKKI